MKIDLHIHTKYSVDSISEPEKIVKIAKKKGLDGIAITDHNTNKGWNDMLKAGKKHGLKIVLGEELLIKTKKGHYEILALFLNERIYSKQPDEVMNEIKDQNGVIAIPHPFDPLKARPNDFTLLVNKIDALEVFNSRVTLPIFNEKALNFAKKHNLGMTGGSDAHIELEAGNAYTIAKANDLESFKRAILRRQTKVTGKLVNPHLRIWTWFNQGISVFK